MNKTKSNPREFISTIIFSISLAWRSSKFYTVVRAICALVSPIASFLIVFLSKKILDLISVGNSSPDALFSLVVLFVSTLFISIIKLVTQRTEQYCKTIHDDILTSKISLILIEKGVTADIEHFDNSEFYNKLTSAAQDSYQFANVLWNVVMSISALFSFSMVFMVLIGQNALYCLILIMAGVPSGLAAARYSKHLYYLSLSQIEKEREKAYVSNIAMDKRYAQDIKLFGAGEFLKNRYTAVWQKVFDKRKKSIKLRGVITGILDCLL